jgi:hypothetical protein
MEERKIYSISRRSPISDQVNTIRIALTQQEYEDIKPYLEGRRLESKGLIQNILPSHSPDEREFILSGISPTEWKELFGEE